MEVNSYIFPNLIPWPGPQAMFSIHKLEVPGPIEIQSSPVPIWEFIMVTLDEYWTWIPSVLGLFPGADTFTPCSFTLSQLSTNMWNIWLFFDVNPLISMLLELEKVSPCRTKITMWMHRVKYLLFLLFVVNLHYIQFPELWIYHQMIYFKLVETAQPHLPT